MPSDEISCTKCSFTSSSAVLWGVYEYLLPDRTRISLECDLAWCNVCQTLVAAEKVDLRVQQEKRSRYLSDRHDALLRLDLLSATFKARLGLAKEEMARLRSNITFYEKQVQDVTLYLNVMSQRTSPPRCLECGSVGISYVERPDLSYTKTAQVTGFRHPGCGGQFIMKRGTIRFSVPFNQSFIYDTEGTFLGKARI